ncbi:alpha/beta fold hydrolase [Rossellomorea sp. NPDC071047]|uniref:alpha/beta fold hydrolase n=1 Tax=Rossellomorea sp. NPDC071047 TaxID=3390675 RepID=UPI003D00C008
MKRKLKTIGLVLLCVLIIIPLSGWIYELVSYRNAEANFPPDGVMIDIGDREIHVNVKGDKTDLPPVVIETGTGNWSYDWSHVQEELSQYTQVLTYDRAGYGWSDPPSNGFALDTTITDLNTILKETKIDTPFILIGHSVGGVYARHFTDRYPEKVAGLILIDSRNEFFKEAAPAYNEKFFSSQDQMYNRILSRLGVTRLFGENTLAGMPDFISKEKYAHVQYDGPFFKALDEEIQQIPENVELLNKIQSLNDKPLTIITPEEVESQAAALGFSEQQENEINEKWINAQEQLAGLSTNSDYISVPNTSHAVMYDQPKVIVEAVLDIQNEVGR